MCYPKRWRRSTLTIGVATPIYYQSPVATLSPAPTRSPAPNTQELEEKFIEELGLTDVDLPDRYLATKKLAEGGEPALMA